MGKKDPINRRCYRRLNANILVRVTLLTDDLLQTFTYNLIAKSEKGKGIFLQTFKCSYICESDPANRCYFTDI